MQISPVTLSNVANLAPAAAATKSGGTFSNVDSSQFMSLLLAQLKNQNPLEPMNDKDMMGQMTQLNSLQELQTMDLLLTQVSQANQASYAASLIGKTVKVGLDDGSTKEGLVTGTSVISGQMTLHIEDKDYPLGNVTEIKGN